MIIKTGRLAQGHRSCDKKLFAFHYFNLRYWKCLTIFGVHFISRTKGHR